MVDFDELDSERSLEVDGPKRNTGKIIIFFLVFLAVIVGVLIIFFVSQGGEPAPVNLPVEPIEGTLKELAERKGILLGSHTKMENINNDDKYKSILLREFDGVIPDGVSFSQIHPERDRYEFGIIDEYVDFTEEHDLNFQYHHVVWGTWYYLPHFYVMPIIENDAGKPWEELTPEEKLEIADNHQWTAEEKAEVKEILKEHIQTLVGRYRGKVDQWSLLNELILPDGSLKNSFWMRTLGKDHIKWSLEWAHEIDPDVVLYINEAGAERPNDIFDGLYDLMKELKEESVPVHAVGLQSHIHQRGAVIPTPEEFRTVIREFSGLDLDVFITELDVSIKTPVTAEDLVEQAEIYEGLVEVCVSEPRCKMLTLWDFTDKYSWIPEHHEGYDAATPFDEDHEEKPAYYAVQRALEG